MDYEKLLRDAGALLNGHFLLTSGLHSGQYIEKFRILENPKLLKPFIEKMDDLIPDVNWVVGPTLGGAIIAFELARVRGVKSAYSERTDNGRVIRRGFDIKEGDTIIIADDILTTGGSIRDTQDSIKKGRILGAVIMIDRSVESMDVDFPVYSVLRYPIENYDPSDCPLCKEGIPITRRGG
ncbi:orotate phosphoribosyltransferase [candidate division WOR-3 bacterium]|nr:orotate phosphoribosyltransferase [candidate division WOR-3 bacterium]MCK4526962.1 orotate phosphoribosyltransferase [candidate division WOR-3 bacterium]